MPENPPLRAPPLLSQTRSRPKGDATGGIIPCLNPFALGACYLACFQEHPKANKVTVRELKSWLPGDARLRSMSGKNYNGLVIRREAKTLSLRLSDGGTVRIDTH